MPAFFKHSNSFIATVVYDATQMNSQSRSVSKYVKRIGMRDFNEVNKFRQGKKTVQYFFSTNSSILQN